MASALAARVGANIGGTAGKSTRRSDYAGYTGVGQLIFRFRGRRCSPDNHRMREVKDAMLSARAISVRVNTTLARGRLLRAVAIELI